MHDFFFFPSFFCNQIVFCCHQSRSLAPIFTLPCTWHLPPPGLAGISERKYPSPSKGKGVLRPAHGDLPHHLRATLQLSTCRPSLGGKQPWCRTPSGVGDLMLWGQSSRNCLSHWKQGVFSHTSFPKLHLCSGNSCKRYHFRYRLSLYAIAYGSYFWNIFKW